VTSRQTKDIKSFLLMDSLGRDTSAIRISSARAPISTGTPSFVRSLSLGTKLKGPNDIVALVCAAGVTMACVFCGRCCILGHEAVSYLGNDGSFWEPDPLYHQVWYATTCNGGISGSLAVERPCSCKNPLHLMATDWEANVHWR